MSNLISDFKVEACPVCKKPMTYTSMSKGKHYVGCKDMCKPKELRNK